MRRILMGAAAAAMVAGSTIAQAAPVSNVRTGAPVADADELAGPALWLGLLAAGLLVFVLFQINDEESDELPVSP